MNRAIARWRILWLITVALLAVIGLYVAIELHVVPWEAILGVIGSTLCQVRSMSLQRRKGQ